MFSRKECIQKVFGEPRSYAGHYSHFTYSSDPVNEQGRLQRVRTSCLPTLLPPCSP